MYTAAVITISDKGYRGEREDTSGPNLVKILKENVLIDHHFSIMKLCYLM